ncbi:MAG TPA: hypothetical protein VF297_01715 [Pyrinomonadaceae bacterium]
MSLTSDHAPGTGDERLLVRYLLEDLSESERGRVEQQYFADDTLYTKLLVTEDDLIDSYVQGELVREDRERFERVYLADPRLNRKVEANRELLEMVGARRSPFAAWRRRLLPLKRALTPGRNTRLAYVCAALLLFVTLCGASGWLLFERSRLRAEGEQARARWLETEGEYQRRLAALQQPTPAPVAVARETPEPVEPGARGGEKPLGRAAPSAGRGVERVTTPLVVAFALPRTGVRAPTADGSAPRPLVIPRGAVLVRLTVELVANEYPAYTVSLRKVGGPVFWSQAVPRKSPPSAPDRVAIDLPAGLFQSQYYIMQVTATDASGEEEILSRHQISAVNHNPTNARPGAPTPR